MKSNDIEEAGGRFGQVAIPGLAIGAQSVGAFAAGAIAVGAVTLGIYTPIDITVTCAAK